MPGHRQSPSTLTAETNTVQTDWGSSLTIPTDDWPAGAYLLRLDAETGAQRFVPITVRSAAVAGKVVLKASTSTWQAYNTWGGYDLYNGPGGLSDYDNRSLVVSLDRPFDQNGAFLFLVHERPLIALAERIAIPVIACSEIGVSRTRPGPNSASSPAVVLNTPPAAPMSSPSTTTEGSRRISLASPSATASR